MALYWRKEFLIHIITYKHQKNIYWNRFVWIQVNPFITVYAERTRLRKKWIKLSIGADILKQIICNIKIRRAPTKHDNIDFKSIITRTSEIKPLSVAVADKGYDSEENHVLVREDLKAYCIIPPRYAHVPIWKTHGRYRKQMKREYPYYCTINVTRMKP